MMFFDQFRDFMILVLIAAAVVAGVIGEPADSIAIAVIVMLNAVLGFVQEYRAEKAMAALTQFGSGWAWLVLRDGKLEIMKTPNADTPIAHGLKPLLTVDVWEHAYYLDYQSRRGDYLDSFIKHLVNWNIVNSNLV